MLDSALLDVCIGLMVVYLTLALATTAANEVLASLLQLRAKNLHSGLAHLLDGQAPVDALLAHPLVQGLDDAQDPSLSWIPRHLFARVVLDLARADATAPSDIEDLRAALRDPQSPLPERPRRALLGLLDDGVTTLEQARAVAAAWFDDAMAAASDRYRARMGRSSLVLAAAITVALDADSLRLAHATWSDDQLRAVMVDRAERLTDDANLVGRQLRAQTETLAAQVEAMKAAGLPLGWSADDVAALDPREDALAALGAWLSRLLGWSITALAASLGAPFWFDVLRAARRPERAPPPPTAGTA